MRGDAEQPDEKRREEGDLRARRQRGERERGGDEQQHGDDEPAPLEHVGERQHREDAEREADLGRRRRKPMRPISTPRLAAMLGSGGCE